MIKGGGDNNFDRELCAAFGIENLPFTREQKFYLYHDDIYTIITSF